MQNQMLRYNDLCAAAFSSEDIWRFNSEREHVQGRTKGRGRGEWREGRRERIGEEKSLGEN